jgi:N4-gp56 family major capsid protein
MWVWDAPTGVYKDHQLSTDIRKEAVAECQFMKFVRPEPGYGVGKGQSVTITRVLQLPIAGRVAETDRLPSGRPAIQTKVVQVSEWGYSVHLTEFEKNLTYFDITNPIQSMLRDHMTITMDSMCAQAFKLTPLKLVPLTAGSVLTTNGSPGANVANKNLDVADLRQIWDTLRNLHVPTFKGGKYVGILTTRCARGIKTDPEYKDWLAPQNPDPFFNGYMKDIENFMLLETNALNSLADLAGTSSVCGEAVFFGADPAFLAVVQNPELRAGIPENLGRFRELGWVGTLEAGLTWEQAAQARVVHVTSA